MGADVKIVLNYSKNSDLEGAVKSFDDAVALLRVKQELEETFSMREAAAAQLKLLKEQPEIYEPAMARQRAQAQQMAAMGMQ